MVKTLGFALVAGVLVTAAAGAPSGPCAHDVDVSRQEHKCQQARSKFGVKFFDAKRRCIDGCVAFKRLFSLDTDPCFTPFSNPTTYDCVLDAEINAVSKIDAACFENFPSRDCPECYAARAGDADCLHHAFGVVVAGLSTPPADSLETQVDDLFTADGLYCGDPTTLSQRKCESDLGKALAKFVACKTKCYDKCESLMCKGTLPPGSCSPPSPTDAKTQECVFGIFKGCEAKAIAACNKACPAASTPACYASTICNDIVEQLEYIIDGNVSSTYCGS